MVRHNQEVARQRFCYTLVYLIENWKWRVPIDVNNISADEIQKIFRLCSVQRRKILRLPCIGDFPCGEERMDVYILLTMWKMNRMIKRSVLQYV